MKTIARMVQRRLILGMYCALVAAGCHFAKPPSVGERGDVRFRFVDGGGFRDLIFGDTPIYRHMTAYDPARREETYKPFHHVFGMHGEGFITKGAGGLDTHHRGIFLGWSTQFGNFWSCKDCSQKFVGYVREREFARGDSAREVSVNEWIDKDGRSVVRDTREVTTRCPAAGEVVMDFDVTIESLAGDVQLGGDPHHGGFHFRAAQEVAGTQPANKSGVGLATYIRPASAKLVKDDVWSDEAWAACCFSVKGNPYVVVHMNSPGNPKSVYSTRAYGRFGTFFAKTLSQGKPLKLRYRILILDGQTHHENAETIARRYEDFTKFISTP